jgi:hypothetical protein
VLTVLGNKRRHTQLSFPFAAVPALHKSLFNLEMMTMAMMVVVVAIMRYFFRL